MQRLDSAVQCLILLSTRFNGDKLCVFHLDVCNKLATGTVGKYSRVALRRFYRPIYLSLGR